ncbi:hypothetical protein PMIN06_005005 [Paraphaeosphaeria minitans]
MTKSRCRRRQAKDTGAASFFPTTSLTIWCIQSGYLQSARPSTLRTRTGVVPPTLMLVWLFPWLEMWLHVALLQTTKECSKQKQNIAMNSWPVIAKAPILACALRTPPVRIYLTQQGYQPERLHRTSV